MSSAHRGDTHSPCAQHTMSTNTSNNHCNSHLFCFCSGLRGPIEHGGLFLRFFPAVPPGLARRPRLPQLSLLACAFMVSQSGLIKGLQLVNVVHSGMTDIIILSLFYLGRQLQVAQTCPTCLRFIHSDESNSVHFLLISV